MTKASTERPLRILQVVGGMNRGGTETWLMHVLRNIDREWYHLDFLVHSDQPGSYDDEIRSLGARVIRCESPSRPWEYARNFNRLLQEYGPYDIVHSHVHHFTGFVLWLAQRAGIRGRIAHSHSDTSALQSSVGFLRRAYLGLTQALIRRHATTGLAASQRAAASLFGPDWQNDPRWRVLFCAVDLAPFEGEPDPLGVRAEFDIPPEARLVGHVGRFVSVKNHAYVVDIAAELLRRNPSAHVVLVGDGPLRDTIQHKVESLGLNRNVHLIGLRPDVPRLMCAMDAFLLPSFYEGLPLVLIEAQAAGLPCFFSDVVAAESDILPELVHRLSISLPPSEWAAAIEATFDEPSFRQQALRRVKASAFQITNGVAELTGLYDNIP
jgi:glycosyltransferase involved in cell wall biosynthesis